MLKTLPRAYVDMSLMESISIFFQLLNVKEAMDNNRVHAFEEAFARYIGTRHAVAFPYCRTGMYFALKALELKDGDEVILPAYTFWVDAAIVIMAGLRPIFVDVQFKSANIDPLKIEKAITSKTKVIFLTHLNGLPADMDPVMEICKKYNLRILEDCARSCSASYNNKKIGSFDIGTFSFGYGKSFYDFGGGMVTSDDSNFIHKLKELKKDFMKITVKDLYLQTVKGIILKYVNNPYIYTFSLYPRVYKFYIQGKEKYSSAYRVKMPPYRIVPDNFRIDLNNIQAKFGFKQLERIDMTNKKRMENARILTEELSEVSELRLPPNPPDREHVAVHYAVWTQKNKDLQRFLIINKIDSQNETAIDTTSLDRFKAYVNGVFPNTKKLHDKVIFLPNHPNLNKNDMLYIANKIKEFFVRRY